MYIKGGRLYYRGTEQCASRAPFLILVQSKDRPLGRDNFRAIARKVALRQCGPWMIGTARIKGESIRISGAYGSDGLPCTVSEKVFAAGVDVPGWLYDAWSNGEGWNSSGNETNAMRAWAIETFKV